MGKVIPLTGAKQQVAKATEQVVAAVGGPKHLQIIAVLAGVLGLVSADLATVSAVSDELKSAFRITDTQIGLLLATVSYATALATLPMGLLADRMSRKKLLIITTATWSVAMAASGFAFSYTYLLTSRIILGVVTAAAWPAVASLAGDFFPPQERAAAFGWIVAGEFIGAGAGFVIAGEVSSALDWRWAFFAMALPAIVLVFILRRYLPEPKRGSQGWLSLHEAPPYRRKHRAWFGKSRPAGNDAEAGATPVSAIQEQATKQHIEPRTELILHTDPERLGIWATIAYLLHLPTYRLLIIASALAYYFLSGLRAFTMIYFTAHYHLERAALVAILGVVGVGALFGVVMGGRVSEALLRRGQINARIVVPAFSLFCAIPPLAGAFWISDPWFGVPLLLVGAALFSAAIAPIDAARLDIVPPHLWGRGEAGRMLLRSVFDGSAPLLFGFIASLLGAGALGLERTFLLMLIPAMIAGGLAIPARKTYPRDVATAAASVKAIQREGSGSSRGGGQE